MASPAADRPAPGGEPGSRSQDAQAGAGWPDEA